jgi:hypothetical protein
MSGKYRSTKDIAATIRSSLKAELPAWKFSVTYKSYSGGSSIDVRLMGGPEEVLEGGAGGAQLNQYMLRSEYQESRQNNGCVLTPKGWEVMSKANEIAHREHWDKSDAQTDYFNCAFYLHLGIGKWDKDYQVLTAQQKGGK